MTDPGSMSTQAAATAGSVRANWPCGRPAAGGSLRAGSVALVACRVLESEIQYFARGAEHLGHVEMVEQGLHNNPPLLRERLQEIIDRVERLPQISTIVLVYGLCSRGVEDVVARRCRMVIARAHDCITHLLGSRQRYADYVANHPGTYWYSPGWNRSHLPPGPERYDALYRDYVARFGEDNAQFLMESEQHWFSSYEQATWVDLGVAVSDADLAYTRRCADWLKWQFDCQRGDPQLLIDLLHGPWDDQRFLVLEPGQTIRMTGDDRIVHAVTISARSAASSVGASAVVDQCQRCEGLACPSQQDQVEA